METSLWSFVITLFVIFLLAIADKKFHFVRPTINTIAPWLYPLVNRISKANFAWMVKRQENTIDEYEQALLRYKDQIRKIKIARAAAKKRGDFTTVKRLNAAKKKAEEGERIMLESIRKEKSERDNLVRVGAE